MNVNKSKDPQVSGPSSTTSASTTSASSSTTSASASRPRSRMSSSYRLTTGSSEQSSATRQSQSLAAEEGTDIIFSPTDDDQHYAQATPSEEILSDLESSKAATELQKALQAIRRYRLDVRLPNAWDQVDIGFLNQLVAQPSPLTAVFISAGDTHVVARSDGSLSSNALSPRLIASLVTAVAEKKEDVVSISDLAQFLEDRRIQRDQLPAEINYFSGSLLRFAPRHGDPEVAVGVVAAFDVDAQHAQQNRRLVAKVAAMTHTVLRNRYLADRRKVELRAQQEMVNLTRLMQGDGSDGANSVSQQRGVCAFHSPILHLQTLGHDGDDQVDAQSDERRIKKSASPDIEHVVFKQAARATSRVLRADLVAIFDVSGFKYDKAAWKDRSGRMRRTTGGSSSDEEYGPIASYEETKTHVTTSGDLGSLGVAPKANADGIKKSSECPTEHPESNNHVGGSLAAMDTTSGRGDGWSSSSDSDGAGTDRQDEYDANRDGRPPRPTLMREEGSRDEVAKPRPDSIVCSYTKSSKPIPLLAASGRGKSHFKLLPGQRSRPRVAKFLASARAAGTPWLSHVEGEQSPLSSDRPVPPRATLLSELLPNGLGGLVALPVFETTHQPAYLILVVFKSAPPAFEDSDRLFVEQIGSCLIASALRIRSQAVDRAQVRLTQRMQHQLRTPLHTIVGMCESAKYMLDCSPETHQMIGSIALSAEALDASLSDIFDYSMMAGIKEPKIARSDVWPETNFRGIFDITTRTCNAAWRLFCLSKAPLHDDRQQIPPPPEMIVTCGPGSWDDLPRKFRFDCEALTRVVSKLVTNALQATSRGIVCVNLAVKTSPRKDGDEELRGISDLHLTVSDTGSGMSKAFLKDHVFRPFTKALENTQGTGLSLSICSSVMSRLGGRVHVTSEVGKGSTFDFVFPFRGKVAPSIKPTGVKIACIPLDDHETARVSFIAFVTFLAHQFGAHYLGNVDKRPELLDEAAIVFIAGERSASDSGKAAIAAQINARSDTRQARQLLVELPNRAFVDPPNSLKADRRLVKFADLDVIQVFRPLVLPDLELMEEVFAEVLMDQEQVKRNEESGAASSLKSLEGRSEQSKLGASSKGTPSIVISGTKKHLASSSHSTSSTASVKGTDRNAGPVVSARRDFVCLVVEDNPLNARILITLLKRVGIDYLEAKDGVEAVEQFKKHLPQVVLLDINMPRMNGFEAAIEMRKVECPYYPRIIAVTALSMEADKLKGKECGIDDWLPKPVRLAQLAQDVKSWKDQGVWYNDVPRQDNGDVSEAPSKGELAQYTTEEAETPNALLYSTAGAQPKTEEADPKTAESSQRNILL